MSRAFSTAMLCMVVIAATFMAAQVTLAEPVIKETREGGTSVIRITSTDGAEKVYRIDLPKRHFPASEQTDLLKKWESYRLGAFVCFNSNQFSGSEHCKITDPKIYNPQHLDVAGWVAAFKAAGMKYAVLTTRHTSGFLLWDSATTNFDVASSGNTTDVCREFVKECHKQGLAPAFYYCLWGGKWKPNPNARAIILAQLYELATEYGQIPYFWLDMMNWAPPDLSAQEIYDAVKALQPNTVVMLNQHVQDGTKINYFPTDVVNGELVLPPATGHDPFRTVDGKTYYLPFEYSLVSQSREGGIKYDLLGPSCWFTYGEGKKFVPSRPFPAEALAKQIRLGWKRGAANVLLATAPDHSGRMRPENVEQLRRLGRVLCEEDGQALGGKTPLQILSMLGAKGKAAVQPKKLEEYRRIFGFIDANDDGDLSTKEFIEDGRYMTRQARQGIFRASDANGDGVVTREEYVTNRIITDEAKAILAKMDEDGDGKVARKEFFGHCGLPNHLSKAVFNEFDTDGNGELVIPEYLRVWGRWARSGNTDR